MKRATVVNVEHVADNFQLITLEGEAITNVTCMPGQKIQITMGSAFVARTYTPIEWDAVVGRTRILGYAHGDGPGSAWIRGLKSGDTCDIFGPRRSSDISDAANPLAVFGDETSMGLAHALQPLNRARTVLCRFEVGEVEVGSCVTARLGRQPDHRSWRNGCHGFGHVVSSQSGPTRKIWAWRRLNNPDPKTFDGGGSHGYTDYPLLPG